MNRKEFHALASQIESHYWLRRVLAYALPIVIIWVVVALFAFAFLEVFATYSFGETEVAVIYNVGGNCPCTNLNWIFQTVCMITL